MALRRWDGRSGRTMGWLGIVVVATMLLACLGSIPYTFGHGTVIDPETGQSVAASAPRYEARNADHALLPPVWAPHQDDERARLDAISDAGGDPPSPLLGTDRLGRSVLVRCLAGGTISLGIGLAASILSVLIGTTYGMLAGYFGGRIDSIMMRIVDILYGLPYILLVVLLAVAVDGIVERAAAAAYEADRVGGSPAFWESFLIDNRGTLSLLTLLVAIGGVSWLTMARVIRGQVLSLKEQPFLEASRAIGVPMRRQFTHHLLPNLMGPIIVYATLTVPQAILSESFLSFLGIGVREPMPSWGNLAAGGLSELNIVRSRWWLLLWPCALVAITLLALNFVGEWLRESLDPRRRQGRVE